MVSKKATMTGMIVGTTAGGLLPSLWGAGMFSFSSVLLSVVGGLFGIWVAFKLSDG